jgi:hypothetical protein
MEKLMCAGMRLLHLPGDLEVAGARIAVAEQDETRPRRSARR